MKSSPKPIAEKWVINASPVIALARVGRVELPTQLPEKAMLPRAVAEELRHAPPSDPARRAVEEGLFKIVSTPAPPPELPAWDLGKGETAVLSYTRTHHEWVAVLDDSAARQCARSFSMTFIGTLAVVILAKQHGLIESAVQVLQDLRNHEFRLEDALIRAVLERTTGEFWTM